MDTRDNQLDELNSQVYVSQPVSQLGLSGGSIGAAPNSPDSLSGALVQTPNSVVGHEAGSNAVLSGGSVGAVPNSSDSLLGAIVQTPNSVSCVDGAVPNSNSALNNVNFKETIDLDNEDINDNAYEASSEGLLSDDESSDNKSDNEKESSTCINKRSENVVPSHSVLSDIESSANMEIGTENVVPSTNPASSGNSVSPGSSLCALSVSS